MTGIAQITPIETEPSSKPRPHRIKVDAWKVAYLVILILALATRLVALGDRAVSHDETTHAKYSWNLYTGRGFRPDPLMHGPLLFEATAFFFALFGVSDFTARLYTALAGVALVMAPWLLRKWLGRLGAVIASVSLLISPIVTYYSRYTRHDIPIMLAAILLLWTILRYLDSGEHRWFWPMGVFFALMYASKENAYIYTAIFFGLMALPLLWQIVRTRWDRPNLIPWMVLLLVIALLAGGLFAASLRQPPPVEPEAVTDAAASVAPPVWGRAGLGVGILAAGLMAVIGVAAVGESKLRSFRLFDVLVVLGTFTLPLGSALLMRFIAGVDMTLFYGALMSGSFAGVPGPIHRRGVRDPGGDIGGERRHRALVEHQAVADHRAGLLRCLLRSLQHDLHVRLGRADRARRRAGILDGAAGRTAWEPAVVLLRHHRFPL